MSPTPQQVRQWSDEVAADPASRAFLPLAEHYRALGKRDAALRLVLRGLERHPHDVEAHYLLGLLYRDGGEQVKAFDEWDIALALAPEHAGSRREIGLLCAVRGDWAAAVRHLERALENDMEDAEVRQALEHAWSMSRGGSPSFTTAGGGSSSPATRPTASSGGPAPSSAPSPSSGPTPSVASTPGSASTLTTGPASSQSQTQTTGSASSRPTETQTTGAGSGSTQTTGPEQTAGAAQTPLMTNGAPAAAQTPLMTNGAPAAAPGSGTEATAGGWGGGREFDALQAEFHALGGERGMLGAVMLDAQGFVLAGRMEGGGSDRAEEVAAVLSGASTEAERAVRHLKMGAWKGILVETADAVVRLSPTEDGGMVAVAGRRDVPMGWVMRVAARAQSAAQRFLAALGGGEAR